MVKTHAVLELSQPWVASVISSSQPLLEVCPRILCFIGTEIRGRIHAGTLPGSTSFRDTAGFHFSDMS